MRVKQHLENSWNDFVTRPLNSHAGGVRHCLRRHRKWNFLVSRSLFRVNFYFKNGCKNKLENNNEKSCSWSRNRVYQKIDFKAVWPRNDHAASVGVDFDPLFHLNQIKNKNLYVYCYVFLVFFKLLRSK